MNKKIKLVFLVVLAAIFLIGTQLAEYKPEVRNLTYEVIPDEKGNPGGGIKLTWEPPLDAPYRGSGCWARPGDPEDWLYIIGVDGVGIDTIHELEYYLYTPGAEVWVNSFDGEDSYSGWGSELDFGAVETPCIDLWPITDPDPEHPSGFGFDENGTAQLIEVSYESYWLEIDYYIDSGCVLTSPSNYEPLPLNDECNSSSVEAGTYYELKAVSSVDNYSTSRDLAEDGLYGLWLDPGADGYDGNDHFSKVLVSGIDGEKITFKLAYQPIGGLRWIVLGGW